MNKSFKGYYTLLFSLMITVIIAYLITGYFDSKNEENLGIPLLKNTTAEIDSTESIAERTLISVDGRKACFKGKLPSYLPGRISENCVDKASYKATTFIPEEKYDIVRVYLIDDSSQVPHNYIFRRK